MCYHDEQMERGAPTYAPERVRHLASNVATRAITITAENDCYALNLTLEDVWQALCDLDEPRCRFHKTMRSNDRSTDIFDVYHVQCGRVVVYLKLRIKTLRSGEEVVVVSFKEK